MSGSVHRFDSASSYAGAQEIHFGSWLCSVVEEICAVGGITAQLQALSLKEGQETFQEDEDNEAKIAIALNEDVDVDTQ